LCILTQTPQRARQELVPEPELVPERVQVPEPELVPERVQVLERELAPERVLVPELVPHRRQPPDW